MGQSGNETCCINFNKGPFIRCNTFVLNALDHYVFHSHLQIILFKNGKSRIDRNITQS